jgi:hypothetical protein
MEDDNTPELWRGGSRVGFIRFAFWDEESLQEGPSVGRLGRVRYLAYP